MHAQSPKNVLYCTEIIGIALAVLQIALYFVDIDSKEYILAGLGLLVVLIPLLVLGTRPRKLREAGVLIWKHSVVLGVLSASSTIVLFLFNDLLYGGIFIIVACVLWYLAAYGNGWHRERLASITTALSRACTAFMLVFLPLYFFYVPLRSLAIDVVTAWDGTADVLVGIMVVCFLVFGWLVAKYRINMVTAAVLLYIWYELDTGWIMRNWDRLLSHYVGTLAFAITAMMVLAINAAFSLGRTIGDTMLLADKGRSGLFGPWFSPFFSRKREAALDARQKRAVKRGIAIGALLVAISAPGLVVAFNWVPVPVTITPRTDYTMRFNFWATTSLNDYRQPVRDALNKHHANLDLGWNINALINLENETVMPNVTYRIVVSPPTFDQLSETIEERTELMLAYEVNHTLEDQWRGFAFDIEGTNFGVNAFENIDEVVAEWNETFDYIYNNATPRRGKPIEMENIGSHVFGVDVPFDGDMDNQVIEGYASNVPDRFTSYAPMIYRCLSSDRTATTAPFSLFNPWPTSYVVYDSLYALNNTVRNATRLGVYLGVTNDSCYSRDLPQPDPITWGTSGGFQNLIRDTLIAKHFGIPEVTFFLQFSVQSQGCNCPEFGAFDSYGDDFLDVMNDSVNTSPPAQFTILYNNDDASLSRLMYRDVLGDVSHISGAIYVIAAAAGSVIAAFLATRLPKRKEEQPARQQEGKKSI
nr:hypothetical protein [Candidatus Sigynarchaeota archaeon]